MNSVNKLTRRITSYINRDALDRAFLKSTLDSLAFKLPETAIFGGMLRDFSLGEARNFSSDIDLVSYATQNEIFNAIREYSPVKNKFGGFRFIVAKQVFDIWSFEKTWAFHQGIVKGESFQDLFKTTFFNLDAAIFHLSKKESYCAEDWEESVQNRVLDVNMKENPFPERMVYRAIRMSIEKKLEIAPQLALFMLNNLDKSEISGIVRFFIEDLEKHIKSNKSENYIFKPQQLLIN